MVIPIRCTDVDALGGVSECVGRLREDELRGMRGASRAGSTSVNVPVRLGEDGVRLVDLDVIPPDPAHLQVVVTVVEAAQAVAGSHADSGLVARLLPGRWELFEAGVWGAVDVGVDSAVLGEQLLRAVVRG